LSAAGSINIRQDGCFVIIWALVHRTIETPFQSFYHVPCFFGVIGQDGTGVEGRFFRFVCFLIFGEYGKGLVFRAFSNDRDFLPWIYLAIFACFLVDGKFGRFFSRELQVFLGGLFTDFWVSRGLFVESEKHI
jgi:hypothetical protein